MRSRANAGAATFLVECYWPGTSREKAAAAVARAGQVAREMTRQGRAVRCVHATFVPAEEVLFCLYEARSVEEVEEANARAEAPVSRIAEAAALPLSAPRSRPAVS
jgi:hypothetical protein